MHRPRAMYRLEDKIRLAAVIITTLIFMIVAGVSVVRSAREEEWTQTVITDPIVDHNVIIDGYSNVQKPEEKLEPTVAAGNEGKSYIYFDVPLSDELQEYIQDLCGEYEFPQFDTVIALIEQESSFRQNVVSSTEDYGLMQINKINHEWLKKELGVQNITDPKENIRCGVYILQRLYHKYGDIEQALIAYNRGETGAAKLFRAGVYRTEYSASILDRAATLQRRETDE